MADKFIVSPSPHIKSEESTMTVMLDVIIALTPALIFSVFVFGYRALMITLVCISACVLFEFLYRKLLKKENTIFDLSAVVTGMLLAFNLPVTAPYWMVIIGAFFAIIIVKQLFGGLGQNFMNPALAARAFLFSWPGIMTTFVKPIVEKPPVFGTFDAVSSATPLVALKGGTLPTENIGDLFLGIKGGCIGEVSAALLIFGGLFLLIRGTISWHIPVSYIGTVALIAFLFPRGNVPVLSMQYELVSGGLMLGAIFMATDYTTSPITGKGKIIYGIGCGLITIFIRYFGGYPEGVSYSILIMNTLVWLIDKKTRTTPYGTEKKGFLRGIFKSSSEKIEGGSR